MRVRVRVRVHGVWVRVRVRGVWVRVRVRVRAGLYPSHLPDRIRVICRTVSESSAGPDPSHLPDRIRLESAGLYPSHLPDRIRVIYLTVSESSADSGPETQTARARRTPGFAPSEPSGAAGLAAEGTCDANGSCACAVDPAVEGVAGCVAGYGVGCVCVCGFSVFCGFWCIVVGVYII